MRFRNADTIVFGVTSGASLRLLGRLPQDLSKLGWAVHIIANYQDDQIPDDFQGIQIHKVPLVRRPSPVKDIVALFRMYKLIRNISPTVISLGTPKVALLGMICSWILRVPVRIYVLRGLRLEGIHGKARFVYILVEKITALLATRVLAVSDSLKKLYLELGLTEKEKILVLGSGSSHGVSLDHLNSDKWSGWIPDSTIAREKIAEKRPVLGFVGRFSFDKGAATLMFLHNYLLSRGFSYTLLIVGPIEDAWQVRDSLLSGNEPAIFCGPVDEVAPFYSIMDVLLLPTKREGFPNVVLEAGAFGVPSVTTPATGAIDAVVNGITGIIADSTKPSDFASCVERLLTDSEFRKYLGRNAKTRVGQEFDEEIVSRLHISFIQGLQGEKIRKDEIAGL